MTGREIINRLEKLTGPDADVDREIHVLMSGATAEWQEYSESFAYHRDGFWVSIGPVPPLTASLDAIVALIEQKLPGWFIYRIDTWHNAGEPCGYGATLRKKGDAGEGEGGYQQVKGGTLNGTRPIALCIALLKAMEAGQ